MTMTEGLARAMSLRVGKHKRAEVISTDGRIPGMAILFQSGGIAFGRDHGGVAERSFSDRRTRSTSRRWGSSQHVISGRVSHTKNPA